jgi:hypothetical protein
MKRLSIGKRLAVAAVAAAALIGPVTSVQAMTFNVGDAVLTVYGNGTEYSTDLGNFSTLLSTGVDLNLSSFLSQNSPTGVNGANTIKYTLVGYTGPNSTDSFFFGDGTQRSSWSTAQLNGVSGSTIQSGVSAYQTAVAGTGSQNLFAASDPASFSTNMDPAGSGSLGGGVPSTRPAFSLIDSTLFLLQRQVSGAPNNSLTQVGTALLNSQTGHFVISAVPVPAAVVLFATGVIGLIGVARRRVFGQQ